MAGCHLTCLLCLLLMIAFVLGEPRLPDLDASKCVVPKPELKAYKPGMDRSHSSSSRSERSTFQQMRFEVWYTESVTNSTYRDLIMNVTQDTVDLISRLLQVKQEPTDFIFSRPCATGSFVNNGTVNNCTCGVQTCGTAQMPEHHLEPCTTCKRYENGTEYDCEPEPGGPTERGVSDVHFILYVTYLPDVCPENVVAFAGPCFLDLTFNRPVVGFTNICAYATETLEPEDIRVTVQHEIYHALGIAADLFAFYRDENGDPLTPLGDNGFPAEIDERLGLYKWSDRVAQTKTLDWDVRSGQIERNVTVMVTPNLVREARDYFGCDSLDGVELEDDYGRIRSGSALSHFESRLFPTESMGPFITKGRRFSRLTMAFLEDTGWYIPNYDLADPYTWGRDHGCGFVNQSCKWWMDTKRQSGESLSPYCEDFDELVCSVDGTSASICPNRLNAEPLPEQYQYFDSLPGYNETELERIGGIFMFLDHCPVIYPLIPLQTEDYRRQTCDRDIDECTSNPCSNGGTCSDIITGYFCTCTPEYEGRHCTHRKSVCSTSEQCARNEACQDGLCNCGQGRIRTLEGCEIPRRFDMRILLIEVNGTLPTYPDTLNNSEQQIRRELEYAIFHRLSRWEIFVDSVYSVNIKSFFAGSLGVDFDIVMNANSTPDDVTIYNVVTDDYLFAAEDLSSGNTAYTMNTSFVVVQDLDECNETAYSACSVYSTCNNTMGSYQCTCLKGFIDEGNEIDRPGTVCTDIDECSNSSLNDCSPYARCNNTPGGYNCSCESGYVDTGSASGRAGRVCSDINECTSQPCLNGGTCRNFKDLYTCECPEGFEGVLCETVVQSCAVEDRCSQIGNEYCSTSGFCVCRPGYLRRNGLCQAIARYKASLIFTSVNGSPLVYTSALAVSSRDGFIQLAQQLRGTLLSSVPSILDIAFTSFRSGSVIGDFDLFVEDGTSRVAVTNAVMTGLGDGTLLAGQDIVGVSTNSISVEDENECASSELNDCSPFAECTNEAGTFSCACPTGYTDVSPTGAGAGRACERDPVEETNSSFLIIILSVFLGIIFILVVALLMIFVCGQLYTRRIRHHLTQRNLHGEDFFHTKPSRRQRSHWQNWFAQPVYEHSYHLDDEHYWSSKDARDKRLRRDWPLYHDRRPPVWTVSKGLNGFDDRYDQRFGFDDAYGRHRLAMEYPGRHHLALEYPDQDPSYIPSIERKQYLTHPRQPRVFGAQSYPRPVYY